MYNIARIAKGHKPLCEIESGLLTYSKGALYSYNGIGFEHIADIKKAGALDSIRIAERMTRKEPKAAVEYKNKVHVAFDSEIVEVSLTEKRVVSRNPYRKDYIHKSRFSYISNVTGFDECIAYGEYFNNAKSEEVAVYTRKADGDWKQAYIFPAQTIRHIHTIIPDGQHNCVYILTGDADSESGIWKATDNFRKVEPLLVGNQAYRACIAFLNEDSILYATDIPSRQNKVMSCDVNTGALAEICDLPGSCTTGCLTENSFIFGTSVETKEPKNKSKLERIKYMFSYRLGEGIQDNKARLYTVNKNLTAEEMVRGEKDAFPVGLCQFGRINAVYCKNLNMLFAYPTAVKKYDGYLCAIEKDEDVNK